MFDQQGYETYVRRKVSLERALEDVGKTPTSSEIEGQMRNIEDRLLARIKQAHSHASQELDAMRFVLRESSNPARV